MQIMQCHCTYLHVYQHFGCAGCTHMHIFCELKATCIFNTAYIKSIRISHPLSSGISLNLAWCACLPVYLYTQQIYLSQFLCLWYVLPFQFHLGLFDTTDKPFHFSSQLFTVSKYIQPTEYFF